MRMDCDKKAEVGGLEGKRQGGQRAEFRQMRESRSMLTPQGGKWQEGKGSSIDSHGANVGYFGQRIEFREIFSIPLFANFGIVKGRIKKG